MLPPNAIRCLLSVLPPEGMLIFVTCVPNCGHVNVLLMSLWSILLPKSMFEPVILQQPEIMLLCLACAAAENYDGVCGLCNA